MLYTKSCSVQVVDVVLVSLELLMVQCQVFLNGLSAFSIVSPTLTLKPLKHLHAIKCLLSILIGLFVTCLLDTYIKVRSIILKSYLFQRHFTVIKLLGPSCTLLLKVMTSFVEAL